MIIIMKSAIIYVLLCNMGRYNLTSVIIDYF